MRDLVGHDHRSSAFFVYLWFTAEQGKSREKSNAKHMGVEAYPADRRVHSESRKVLPQPPVAWLIQRKLLASTKKTVTATPRYKVLVLGGAKSICAAQRQPQTLRDQTRSGPVLPNSLRHLSARLTPYSRPRPFGASALTLHGA